MSTQENVPQQTFANDLADMERGIEAMKKIAEEHNSKQS